MSSDSSRLSSPRSRSALDAHLGFMLFTFAIMLWERVTPTIQMYIAELVRRHSGRTETPDVSDILFNLTMPQHILLILILAILSDHLINHGRSPGWVFKAGFLISIIYPLLAIIGCPKLCPVPYLGGEWWNENLTTAILTISMIAVLAAHMLAGQAQGQADNLTWQRFFRLIIGDLGAGAWIRILGTGCLEGLKILTTTTFGLAGQALKQAWIDVFRPFTRAPPPTPAPTPVPANYTAADPPRAITATDDDSGSRSKAAQAKRQSRRMDEGIGGIDERVES